MGDRDTRIVVLGAGMIGSAIVMDLRNDGWPVTVADTRPAALERLAARHGAATVTMDLGDPRAVARIAEAHDLVVGALPSVLGFRTVEAVIAAKRNMVDISFMPEDALLLGDAARARGVTVLVDCGVAPGVSNLMVGHAAHHLEECRNVEIYVGGLPRERRWPFEYKAGFAPHDVIEEYVRPSRMVEHGEVVVKEALSDPELMDFPGVGTLEAFNTDGLRSIVQTIRAPFMKEKTLRYPGHIALMRAFRETGLFSKEPVEVGGQRVRPLDLTAALLFPKWTFAEGEADVTVLRVIVDGTQDGAPVRYAWDLFDTYDSGTRLRSMSRTTAFPAAALARLLAKGEVHRPGVHPPETLGAEEGMLEAVLGELRARGVRIEATVARGQGREPWVPVAPPPVS